MGKSKSQPPKWTYGNADINEAIARRFAEEAAQQPAQSPAPQTSPTPPQEEYNPNRFRYDQPATMQAVQEGIKRGELVRDSDNRVFRTRPKKDNPKEHEQEKEALYNIAKGSGGAESIVPRTYGNVEQAQNPEMEFNRLATGEQGDEGFLSGLSSKMKALSQYLTVPSKATIPQPLLPLLGAILPDKPIPLTDEARRKAFAESRGKTYLPTTEPRGVGATVGEIAGDLGVGAAAMLATGGSGAAALIAGAAIPEAVSQLGRFERQEASGAEAVGRTLVAGAAGALQAGIVPKAAKAVAQGSAPLRAKLTEIAGKQGQMLGAQALRSVAAVAKEGGAKIGAKIVGQNVGVAAGQAGANAALEGVVDSTPDEPVRQAMNGDVLPLAKDIATQTAFGTVGGLAFSPLDVNASALLKSMPATKNLLSTSTKQVAESAIESAAKEQVQNEAAQQAVQQAARTFNPSEFPLALKEATGLSKLQRQAGIDPRVKQGMKLLDDSYFGGSEASANPQMAEQSLSEAVNLAKITGADVENMNAQDVAKHLVEVASGTKPLRYVQELGETPVLNRVLQSDTKSLPIEKELADRELAIYLKSQIPTREERQAALYLLSPPESKTASIDYLNRLDDTQLESAVEKAIRGAKGTEAITNLPEKLASRVEADDYNTALKNLNERQTQEVSASDSRQQELQKRTRSFMKQQVARLKETKAEEKHTARLSKQQEKIDKAKQKQEAIKAIQEEERIAKATQQKEMMQRQQQLRKDLERGRVEDLGKQYDDLSKQRDAVERIAKGEEVYPEARVRIRQQNKQRPVRELPSGDALVTKQTQTLLKDFNKRNPLRKDIQAAEAPETIRLPKPVKVTPQIPQSPRDLIRSAEVFPQQRQRLREVQSTGKEVQSIITSSRLKDHPKPDIASPASNPADNVAPKMAYISEPVTPKDIARITKGADYRKDWEARGIKQGTPEFDAMLAKRTDIEKKANMNARILGLDATRTQAPHLDDMYYGKPLLRSAREAEREVGKALTQVEKEGKALQKEYGTLRQKNNKLLEAVAETNFRQYEEYLAAKNELKLR